jgi:hypothetical protein
MFGWLKGDSNASTDFVGKILSCMNGRKGEEHLNLATINLMEKGTWMLDNHGRQVFYTLTGATITIDGEAYPLEVAQFSRYPVRNPCLISIAPERGAVMQQSLPDVGTTAAAAVTM